jgi:hypothetical protein
MEGRSFQLRWISIVGPEERKSINLLTLKPLRNLEWETRENELVVLIVPKFRSRLAKKWFVPMLARPHIRVKLDAFGSYLWNKCDGTATVQEIGEQMAKKFGEPVDPLYDRIGKFVRTLARDKFILLNDEQTTLSSVEPLQSQ